MERKLNLLGHIILCRMKDKTGEGGVVWNDGRRMRRRKPCRERLDDIKK